MRRALTVLLATGAFAVLPAGTASAHPLGNFTVNTADRLELTADGLAVTHVVDLAEIPTVQLGQARAGVDRDRDEKLSPGELTAYASRECARVAPLLTLEVDGAAAPLRLTAASGQARPGTAGLKTTRVSCSFATGVRPRTSVTFDDAAAGERNGWREVSARSSCGPLLDSTVPVQSPSGLLTSYPADLLQSPVDVTGARFAVRADAACSTGPAEAGAGENAAVAGRGVDRISRAFTDFLGRPELTLPFAVVSLLAAVLFGVLHALAPGHGKTVMAAYLVGQRGTRRQALQLGAVVTFTHTASVLLLGAVLALGALAAPELVVPFTEVLSGVLLVAVGGYLLLLAARRRARRDHDHRTLVAVGARPPAVPDADAPRTETRPGTAPATAARPVPHTHGGRTHTHAPLPEGPLSWKALVGMGVAGGLVPSPSALLVLLSATALGRAWFGTLLVVAYGLGMAVTLTAAGLLLLRARAVLDRRGWSLGRGRSLVRLLPWATAAIVVLVGLGLVVRGLTTGQGLL